MLTIPTFRKPLLLLHLLYTLQLSNVLCFTKSVESAGRLVLLLEAFNRHSNALKAGQLRIANYSSELQPSQRKTILEDFTLGKVQVLICSDLIARGMDLPSVENVVNYDVPVDMRKYVHRVGRTARAGREGHAWSLVESQEASHIQNLLGKRHS
jgi:ATP-dependent RNA helicase DDX51/DBP6